ncbi:MAG: hypothetical protein EOO06_19950 [Chitinophagaceae bacterium]|nr:MAG: hypothetical protein EOO06_19950 [Chitinophagaceae bacterium]
MRTFYGDLTINEGYYRFCFQPVYCSNGIRFFVKVVHPPKRFRVFEMEQRSEQWRVVNAPKADDFILAHEARLSVLLEELYKKNSAVL